MLVVRKKSQWIFLRPFSCWVKIPYNPQKLSIILGILLFCQHGVPKKIRLWISFKFYTRGCETNSIPPRIFDYHLLKPSCKKIVASVAPAAFSEHFAFPPGEWHHPSAASYGSGPLQAPSYMTAKLLDRCIAPVAYYRWMTCAASCEKHMIIRKPSVISLKFRITRRFLLVNFSRPLSLQQNSAISELLMGWKNVSPRCLSKMDVISKEICLKQRLRLKFSGDQTKIVYIQFEIRKPHLPVGFAPHWILKKHQPKSKWRCYTAIVFNSQYNEWFHCATKSIGIISYTQCKYLIVMRNFSDIHKSENKATASYHRSGQVRDPNHRFNRHQGATISRGFSVVPIPL